VVGLALAAATSLAACGDDDAEGSTEASEPTTTTAPDLEADVLAAYEASEDALLAAGDPPNPDDTGLAATRTGNALVAARNLLERFRAEGGFWRGTIEHQPEVVSVDETTAVISDCLNDLTSVYNAAGEVVEGNDGVPEVWTSTLVLEGTDWKITEYIKEGQPC
jgi:hypothetical protein